MGNMDRNIDMAIMCEVRRSLSCAMLVLYEQAGWNAEGLLELAKLFLDYNYSMEHDPEGIRKLTERFEHDVGYYLDDIKNDKGTAVQKAVRYARAQSIKICAAALYDQAGWETGDIRKFIRTMWDYTNAYPDHKTGIDKMVEDTGLDKYLKFDFNARRKKKKR